MILKEVKKQRGGFEVTGSFADFLQVPLSHCANSVCEISPFSHFSFSFCASLLQAENDYNSDTVVGRNGETIGDICNKYFAGREGVSTEDRQKVMRFLENICLGAAAVGYRTESLHGAGSPKAQRIMIARQSGMEQKKKFAKTIAGIKMS